MKLLIDTTPQRLKAAIDVLGFEAPYSERGANARAFLADLEVAIPQLMAFPPGCVSLASAPFDPNKTAVQISAAGYIPCDVVCQVTE